MFNETSTPSCFSPPTALRKKGATQKQSTLIVEILILFMCLLMLSAVALSLFAAAKQSGVRTAHTQHALSLAENYAERFAANPQAIQTTQEGLYNVMVQITPEEQSTGILYKATIAVLYENDTLCTLNTARYVSTRAALLEEERRV